MLLEYVNETDVCGRAFTHYHFDLHAVNKTARNDPNRVPIVNVFNTGIHDDPIKTHILIFVDRRKDYWQSLQKNFIEVAREYDDRLLHVVVPSDDTEINHCTQHSEPEQYYLPLVPYQSPAEALAPIRPGTCVPCGCGAAVR